MRVHPEHGTSTDVRVNDVTNIQMHSGDDNGGVSVGRLSKFLQDDDIEPTLNLCIYVDHHRLVDNGDDGIEYEESEGNAIATAVLTRDEAEELAKALLDEAESDVEVLFDGN